MTINLDRAYKLKMDNEKLISKKIKSIENKDTQLLAEIVYLSTELIKQRISELDKNVCNLKI